MERVGKRHVLWLVPMEVLRRWSERMMRIRVAHEEHEGIISSGKVIEPIDRHVGDERGRMKFSGHG